MRFLSETNRLYRLVTMTDGATVTPNADTTDVGTVTLGGNRTMAAPSGTPRDGQSLVLRIVQDGTGGRTVTWNSAYSFPGDLTPQLHTAASRVDLFEFRYRSSDSKWYCINRDLSASLTGKLVGWHVAEADSEIFNGTASEIIISASASVINGRTYLVQAVGELVTNGAGGAVTVESWLRYTLTGVEPTTGATALGRAESRNDSTGGVPRTVLVQGYYSATSNSTFYVGLFSQRVEGSVNVQWTGGSGRPVTLTITDIGPTIAETGNYNLP